MLFLNGIVAIQTIKYTNIDIFTLFFITNQQANSMEVAYLKVCFTIHDIREKGKHYFVLQHCEFCIVSVNHVYSTAKKIPYTGAKIFKKISNIIKKVVVPLRIRSYAISRAGQKVEKLHIKVTSTSIFES